MAKTLIWLASYPKSGNTWLRAFLANYLMPRNGPLPLESLRQISHGDVDGQAYTALSGLDPAKLSPEQLFRTRRRHLEALSESGETVFVKTHHPVGRIGPHAFIPADLTRAAICIVRNPLDMVLSYSDHFRLTHDAAATAIAFNRNMVPPTHKTAAQFLGNWSEHVGSWLDAEDFPVLVLRYEDLLQQPHAAFTQILQAIGAPVEQGPLDEAIEAASFSTLSRLEAQSGFSEKGAAQQRFFRAGTEGQWRDALAPDIVRRIRHDHARAMQYFGYL